MFFKKNFFRNLLVIQWLGLYASTAGNMNSVSGWGMKIPQAKQHGPPKNKPHLHFLHFSDISVCQIYLNEMQRQL